MYYCTFVSKLVLCLVGHVIIGSFGLGGLGAGLTVVARIVTWIGCMFRFSGLVI